MAKPKKSAPREGGESLPGEANLDPFPDQRETGQSTGVADASGSGLRLNKDDVRDAMATATINPNKKRYLATNPAEVFSQSRVLIAIGRVLISASPGSMKLYEKCMIDFAEFHTVHPQCRELVGKEFSAREGMPMLERCKHFVSWRVDNSRPAVPNIYSGRQDYMSAKSCKMIHQSLMVILDKDMTPTWVPGQRDTFDKGLKDYIDMLITTLHLRTLPRKKLILSNQDIQVILKENYHQITSYDVSVQYGALLLMFFYTLARPSSLLPTISYQWSGIRLHQLELWRTFDKTEGEPCMVGFGVKITIEHFKGHHLTSSLSEVYPVPTTVWEQNLDFDLAVQLVAHLFRSGYFPEGTTPTKLWRGKSEMVGFRSDLKQSHGDKNPLIFRAIKAKGMGLQKSAPLKAAGALERFQRLGKACGIGQTDADAAFSLTAVRRTGATKLMDKLGVIKTQMFMGHRVGTNTLAQVYDQSKAAVNLAAAMLDEPDLERSVNPNSLLSRAVPGGYNFTLRDAIAADFDLGYLAANLHCLEKCMKIGSTDWLDAEMFRDGGFREDDLPTVTYTVTQKFNYRVGLYKAQDFDKWRTTENEKRMNRAMVDATFFKTDSVIDSLSRTFEKRQMEIAKEVAISSKEIINGGDPKAIQKPSGYSERITTEQAKKAKVRKLNKTKKPKQAKKLNKGTKANARSGPASDSESDDEKDDIKDTVIMSIDQDTCILVDIDQEDADADVDYTGGQDEEPAAPQVPLNLSKTRQYAAVKMRAFIHLCTSQAVGDEGYEADEGADGQHREEDEDVGVSRVKKGQSQSGKHPVVDPAGLAALDSGVVGQLVRCKWCRDDPTAPWENKQHLYVPARLGEHFQKKFHGVRMALYRWLSINCESINVKHSFEGARPGVFAPDKPPSSRCCFCDSGTATSYNVSRLLAHLEKNHKEKIPEKYWPGLHNPDPPAGTTAAAEMGGQSFNSVARSQKMRQARIVETSKFWKDRASRTYPLIRDNDFRNHPLAPGRIQPYLNFATRIKDEGGDVSVVVRPDIDAGGHGFDWHESIDKDNLPKPNLQMPSLRMPDLQMRHLPKPRLELPAFPTTLPEMDGLDDILRYSKRQKMADSSDDEE